MRSKVRAMAANEAGEPNVIARGFGGRVPRIHICSYLTYARVGASRNHARLPVDPCNGEIVGHPAGLGKDARLDESAFATLSYPISGIEVLRTGRSSEFANAEIDLTLEAFGVEMSLSAKGHPYDSAVGESANRALKAECVSSRGFEQKEHRKLSSLSIGSAHAF